MSISGQRAFANKINKRGSAAEVRRNLTSSYLNEKHYGSNMLDSSLQLNLEPIPTPPDVENFYNLHASVLKNDPLTSFFLFPDDDLKVQKVEKKYKEFDLNKNEDVDKHMRECIDLYNKNFFFIKRNYQNQRREEFAKIERDRLKAASFFPQYEIYNESRNCSTNSLNTLPSSSSSSSPLSEPLDQESIKFFFKSLLNDISQLDFQNHSNRSKNRLPNLFALYQLNDEYLINDGDETMDFPYEVQSHKLFFNLIQLKLDVELDPIFCTVALYDLASNKKISENFYCDLNSDNQMSLLAPFIPYKDLSTKSTSAVFNITHPNPDIFIVFKLEKVLQQGELSEVLEPYLVRDEKVREKARFNMKGVCGRLGKFRMSLAWSAVNLANLVAEFCGKEFSKTDSLDRGRGSKISMGEKRLSLTGDEFPTALETFRPFTSTVQSFFKLESERISDDEILKNLQELKKPALSKKLKQIPGQLKFDLSVFSNDTSNLLTPDLYPLSPHFAPKGPPTKELVEFPTRDVLIPYSTFRNLLFVYPKQLNLANRQGSARNIAVKVQIFDHNHNPLPILFGKSNCPEMQTECFSNVIYHNKNPSFFDEVKVKLPINLVRDHYLRFTFYHISCQLKKDLNELETVVGYTWLPLLRDNRLVMGDFNLPISLDLPPKNNYFLHPDVMLPNIKWLDNHKGLFTINITPVTSIHTLDESLNNFITLVNKIEQNQITESIDRIQLLLSDALQGLLDVRDGPLIKFLHLIFNKLFYLLLHPLTVADKIIEIRHLCFETITNLVLKIQANKNISQDKFGRNLVLVSFVNFYCYYFYDLSKDNTEERRKKYLHEEVCFQLVSCSSGMSLNNSIVNSWFFFDLISKSMEDMLIRENKMNLSRQKRFPASFLNDLSKLIELFTVKLIKNTLSTSKESELSTSLNRSIALFLRNCLSTVDRGFVFRLLKIYYSKIREAMTSNVQNHFCNLSSLKLDLLQLVSAHEHFIPLNLPFSVFHPQSSPPSPSSSIDSISLQLSLEKPIPSLDYLPSKELNNDYISQHFLIGLLLNELKCLLETNHLNLQHKIISIITNLIANHDLDNRYQDKKVKARITHIYLPLVAIVMSNLNKIYYSSNESKFLPQESLNQSVALAIAGSNSFGSEENKRVLSIESSRDLLMSCFWILKHSNVEVFWHVWTNLWQPQINRLLDMLYFTVSNFEFKQIEKQAVAMKTCSSNSDIKNKMEEIILGSRSARMKMIKRRTQDCGSGFMDDSRLRWNKEQIHFRVYSDHSEGKLQEEAIIKIEKLLSNEMTLVALDTLELIIQIMQNIDQSQNNSSQVLRVLLHCLTLNQSSFALQNIFATQRVLVLKFPELIFEEDTEQCADLCLQLLRHCSSSMEKVRVDASVSLYLLMRQNFEIGNTFARVKMQVTMSLSSLVGQNQSCNEERLKESLTLILFYSDEDEDLKETTFPEQVGDLVMNLRMILSDTFKMKEYHSDPEMLIDLMYRIAKGYQNSPDLRLTWLENMAAKHYERKNFAEAGQCLLHASGLVAEYLNMLEDKPYLPIGCVALQHVSRNVLEESAVSEDVVSPEEEGICTGKYFSEAGLSALLEKSASYFFKAAMFEVPGKIYKVLLPIYENTRDYRKLSVLHNQLHDAYENIVKQDAKRVFGTYFRVGFYGIKFDDLDEQEFVCKEPPITKLSEISHRLENFYLSKFGANSVEIIKDSNTVDKSLLDPSKGYIQITYVEPYFDLYEMKERQTIFEKNFNIKRFMYATPFTKVGKAHGELGDQYKRKTILTTSHSFPYIKTRLAVISKESFDLTPIEVAIEDIQKKIKELTSALRQDPTDPKILQMVLQGCIGATVNQGPVELAIVFLGPIKKGETPNKHHNKLRSCFKDFLKKCGEALHKNKTLISADQKDYQHELEKNFKQTKDHLSSLINSTSS